MPGSIRRQFPDEPPIRRSSHVGGFTFPEDPELSCATVRPLWSAAVDPHVLVIRASEMISDSGSQSFDIRRYFARVLRDISGEYVLIEHASGVIRLDVVNGSLCDGPVSLCFEVPEERDLPTQIDALRAFHALRQGSPVPTAARTRMARQLLALHAFDARRAGYSLRAISEGLLGPGWPGDGEHRKSRVRRLVSSGEALMRAGAVAVLQSRV
jgi:hypothetical protein